MGFGGDLGCLLPNRGRERTTGLCREGRCRVLRFFTERMQSRAQQLQCAVFVCDGQRRGCIGWCGRHCSLYLEGGDELPPPPPRRRRLGLGADMKGGGRTLLLLEGREGLKKEWGGSEIAEVEVRLNHNWMQRVQPPLRDHSHWSCIGCALPQQHSCQCNLPCNPLELLKLTHFHND